MKITELIEELKRLYEKYGEVNIVCEGINDQGHIGDYPLLISHEVDSICFYADTDADEI